MYRHKLGIYFSKYLMFAKMKARAKNLRPDELCCAPKLIASHSVFLFMASAGISLAIAKSGKGLLSGQLHGNSNHGWNGQPDSSTTFAPKFRLQVAARERQRFQGETRVCLVDGGLEIVEIEISTDFVFATAFFCVRICISAARS
ncbi:hypothetical protein FN846DRAFT_892097 [Sphaerosporella brunnea]|uniref:Uncharacterized protein n=1 Tax=Sphaerosporella brunnea TaxID=1250544 RepID=A0A5J5ESA0_9PEZI|nr:hypothetical protein FN846DRAFT_892097 [Sphaerosporella brunnea]